ncbi:CoA binding domain-containing protein [Aspergillus cavernicola]|uniref:CoA binding domain-containing protein n=1 Tax=Aspergillus cavernicola TaxID=176166 RepID=A0ABR4IZ31_9EURO
MEAVKRFFSSPRFAVAGASNDSHKFGYKLLAWYHQHSLPVTPLNPRSPSIQLSPSHSYQTVASPSGLPSPPQTSLSVVTPPAVTLSLLQEAHSVGIPAVWLQPGTFDDAVLDFARSHFEAVIAGDGGGGSEGWCSSSFLFDSPIPPHLDLVGAPSPLFQIPPTPSASSALYRSISISHHRKRCHPELENTRVKVTQTPHRPPPLVHDFFADLDESYDHEDHDFYRPSRYRDYPRTPLDASLTDSGKEPDDFRRKRCRLEDPSLVIAASPSGIDEKAPTPEQMPTVAGPLRWSRAVLNVVGKVWDFCWSGPFRGFYAGGGRGYPLDPPQPLAAEIQQDQSPSPHHYSRHSSSVILPPSAEKEPASVSGEYPLQTGDQDFNNWVMVSSREGTMSSISPSVRPRSRRRQLPRGRVVHRRSPSSKTPKRAIVSHPASNFSEPAKPTESPVSVETQRYIAQQRRQEREEDASIRRLNRQLQAMIQEGKQALGTRVEVDDMDMDMED